MKECTVLMSAYNGEKYIKQQIDSILEQEECIVRLIVRDDGSTDCTKQILSQYQEQGKLQWYSDGDNLGPAKSFLTLLYKAPESPYYAFADQDDLWEKRKLCESLKKIENLEIPAITYTNAELVDFELNSYGQTVFNRPQKMSLLKALCSCNVMGCTMVFNAELVHLLKKKEMPETLIMHDAYLCAVCAACGGTIRYVGKPLMRYRQHGSNSVGYNTDRSLCGRVKDKMAHILGKRKVQVDKEAEEIWKYREFMPAECASEVRRVMNYRKKTGDRICLSVKLFLLFLTGKGTKHELLTSVTVLFGNA